ncbi:MAG: tetratricopeptide repeat protein, partial [Pseudanabaena sp.]
MVIGGFLVKRPLPSCAESISQSSRQITPEILRAWDYFRDGVDKQISGDLYGAIADLTEAIRIKKDYIYAYFARGSLKEQLGDKKGAIADYTAAIQIKPQNAQDYLDRGDGKSFYLRDKKGAITDYT